MISKRSLSLAVADYEAREEILVNKLAAGIESSIADAVLDRYDLLQEVEHCFGAVSF